MRLLGFYSCFLTVIGLTSLLFQGCGQPAPNLSKVTIIGGRPASDAEFPETVAIMRAGSPICSGTLVSTTTVISAAHCLESQLPSTPESLKDLEVYFGNDATSPTSGKISGVKRVAIHPDFWKDHLSARDFALLEIENSFDVVPAELLLDRKVVGSMVDVPADLIIVGFGLSSNEPSTTLQSWTGIKNLANARIQGEKADELFVGDSTSDTCVGDSGGPAFTTNSKSYLQSDSKLRLVAVTSRGPTPCARDRDPGIMTSLRAGVCWFSEFTSHSNKAWEEACRLEETGFLPTEEYLTRNVVSAKALSLSSYNVRDISWLSGAKNLESINLSWNRVRDISALLTIPTLKNLDIRGNELEDLNALEILKQRGIVVRGSLTQKANLEQTEFSRISAMGARAGVDQRSTILALRAVLTNGTTQRRSHDLATRVHLGLENRDVRSLLPLAHLENLETLLLARNPKLKDLEVLKTLPRLRYVDLTELAPSESTAEMIKELRLAGVEIKWP